MIAAQVIFQNPYLLPYSENSPPDFHEITPMVGKHMSETIINTMILWFYETAILHNFWDSLPVVKSSENLL